MKEREEKAHAKDFYYLKKEDIRRPTFFYIIYILQEASVATYL